MDEVIDRPAKPIEQVQLGATEALPKPNFEEDVKITKENFDAMLRFAVANGCDDVILLVGFPWSVMWSDKIIKLGTRDLYMEEMEALLNEVTNNRNASIDIAGAIDIDFIYSIKVDRIKTLRFRANATGTLGPHGSAGMELVLRPVGKIPPTMEQLGVPIEIQRSCMPKSGIVLICGPTGSGKTTLLDSILRAQATHPDGRHIITYYAPIENDLNVIPNNTALIAQTEIGVPGYGAHLTSFGKATRNSLRRHPTVIVYGEARDKETIEGAILSSQTGHTTYTTTHTSNVHMAISRMTDAFPGSERVRVTNALIDNVRLIVHQRLLRTPSGIGRYPIRSWLEFTQPVRSELLRTPVDLVPSKIAEMTSRLGRDLLADAEIAFAEGKIHEDELVALRAELQEEESNRAP